MLSSQSRHPRRKATGSFPRWSHGKTTAVNSTAAVSFLLEDSDGSGHPPVLRKLFTRGAPFIAPPWRTKQTPAARTNCCSQLWDVAIPTFAGNGSGLASQSCCQESECGGKTKRVGVCFFFWHTSGGFAYEFRVRSTCSFSNRDIYFLNWAKR